MIPLDFGDDVSQISFSVDGPTDANRELSVTEPATVTKSNAFDVVSNTTLLAGPGKSTYISCADEPKKIEGRWEPVDFVLFTDFGAPYGTERVAGEFVEVGYVGGLRGTYVSLSQVFR